jgi:hypothetical protein
LCESRDPQFCTLGSSASDELIRAASRAKPHGIS